MRPLWVETVRESGESGKLGCCARMWQKIWEMGALGGTATESVLKGAKVLMRMDVVVIVAMLSQ